MNKLHSTRIHERSAYLILWVTTAITSSWAAADRRKVTNIARDRENLYEAIVDAYTCRRRKLCTGLFHLRENSSHEVEFHCDKRCVNGTHRPKQFNW